MKQFFLTAITLVFTAPEPVVLLAIGILGCTIIYKSVESLMSKLRVA